MARSSYIEGGARDLQTAVDTLSANKQDTISNAEVVEGASCFGRCESKQDWHQGQYPSE